MATQTSRARRPKAPPPDSSEPDDPVLQYAKDVLAGRIIAGPWVRLACQRHLDDLKDGPARGLVWSLDHATRAIAFFEEVLKLNGGTFEGKPFLLLGWQKFCVGSIFGWLNAEGFRRFRTAYMEIGKGAGKSPLAAGIGLYCLCSDNESRAEVYAAATKKDQAMILFRDAVAMVDLSASLRTRLVKTGGRQCWNLAFNKTSSFFRAISSDDGQSGPRPHCSLIDELHEHPNGIVCDMLKAGQKFRRQPLTIKITNAGFDRETVCYRDHEYSTRVVQGVDANDEWFAYVCALDPGDEPIGTSADPFSGRACWIKTNPSLGVTIRDDYIEGQIRDALGMPGLLSLVRRLNFCEWVDAAHPWIEGPLWFKCEHEFDAIAELAQCEEVVGSLDLGGTRDMCALTLAGTRKSDGKIIAHNEYWTPGDTLHERARADKVAYDLWVERGFLHTTPGRAVDYAFVARRIADLAALLPLYRICFDPYRISYLEPEIDATGAEIELIAHPQGGYRTKPRKDKYGNDVPSLWMPRSIELLEKAVGDARLVVHKNPCLTWNSASAVLVATDDKGNLIFSKRRSRGRIDGIVTLAMAVGLLESGDNEDPIAAMLAGEAIIA